MASELELLDIAKRLMNFEIAFDFTPEVDALTTDEKRRVLVYVAYEAQRRRRPENQKRAKKLLLSWLTDDQRDELRRREFFTVTGSEGGVYRLRPRNGHVERVEKHGKHWFAIARYCYHDALDECPPADNTLAHLMILSTDEGRFLREANVTHNRPQCWDSEYMTMRARIRREEAQRAAA